MTELLHNFEPYILNDTNMQSYLKYKFSDLSESKCKTKKEYKNEKKIDYLTKFKNSIIKN